MVIFFFNFNNITFGNESYFEIGSKEVLVKCVSNEFWMLWKKVYLSMNKHNDSAVRYLCNAAVIGYTTCYED